MHLCDGGTMLLCHSWTLNWERCVVAVATCNRLLAHVLSSHRMQILDALEASGLRNSTWVVLIGDHGWSLGEHGTFERACSGLA